MSQLFLHTYKHAKISKNKLSLLENDHEAEVAILTSRDIYALKSRLKKY